MGKQSACMKSQVDQSFIQSFPGKFKLMQVWTSLLSRALAVEEKRDVERPVLSVSDRPLLTAYDREQTVI